VLVAVVIGGGYIFWRVSQTQYYVAANSSGQVVLYRGINYRILWFNLYSPYRPTGIQLTQVPETYRQTVTNPNGSGSLAQAQTTVGNVRAAVSACQSAYVTQQSWVTKENAYNAYQAKLAAAKKKHPTGGTANLGPPVPNPGPRPLGAGQQPSSTGGLCPSSDVYGIPASALNPDPSGSS
jgi:hypothetical protein